MSQRRPSIIGPSSPESPYPVNLKGPVSKGFGRGSKDLGIPTANLPEEVAEAFGQVADTGIYYGWASVGHCKDVLPMVMSFGWNPYYKNEMRSAEVHIIHQYEHDFYGEELRVIVTGYIRAEKNYESLDALIEDINTDIAVAQKSLARPAYEALRTDPFITGAAA
ncbi:riboflavin kinase [Geranomyces variabilis]|uniref:Riboflavin kinase n=1 Tax=Geranomyces variabilis TaxID=109894 RepID=A0AAD5TLD0_9FUNG|nr:riboflavin kinase [Geranomyces variabilis]